MDNLADSWKGIDVEQTWESVEYELATRAKSDPTGQLNLTFVLRESVQAHRWTAQVAVQVEPCKEDRVLWRLELRDYL